MSRNVLYTLHVPCGFGQLEVNVRGAFSGSGASSDLARGMTWGPCGGAPGWTPVDSVMVGSGWWK